MKAINRTRESGFSLLEVMIAVVVLATGLLALAALQGSLTRASAEAKVRGRVAALLSAHMDELRATQYTSAATLADDGCATDLGADDWVPASFCQEAGIGAITATQTVTLYSSAVGDSSFSTTHTPAEGEPEFKRVVLTATWADAGGTDHRLAMDTQLSDLALKDSLLPNPPITGTPTGAPVVRQDSPETAGVIPIAMGNGDSSAASNPTPELVGKNNNQTLVGTRFNVLTYTPTGSSAVIQKRFENDVIKCSCQYGAGGTNLPEIYRTAQWPAVWTGTRYDVYEPDPVADAPGQAYASGPQSGVEQSPLCQECCRDHHDGTASDVARFDPEATGAYQRYNPNGSGQLVAVGNTTNAKYVDSCRIIRVDGFWRTASDMYSRQFGLLETGTGNNPRATTGLPTANATAAYTSFVKNYLKQYDGSVATAPTGAQATYDGTTNINDPATVTITTPSTSDFRYLHARGLYVDYLEEKARNKLVSVLASTDANGLCPTGTALEDCVLPYLPFTTINLTELAGWAATDDDFLNVNESGSLFNGDPSEPLGGATRGIAEGSADTNSTMRKSNSGVAASSVIPGAVDLLGDGATASDSQNFTVGTGGNTNTGDDFFVSMSGGGLDLAVDYTMAGDSGPCTGAIASKRCVTNSDLPLAGSIVLSSYNGQQANGVVMLSAVNPGLQCMSSNKGLQTVPDVQITTRPMYHNYEVKSVSDGGAIGIPSGNGTNAETTTVTFTPIPDNGSGNPITIVLGDESGSPIAATFVSCTADKVTGNYVFGTAQWQAFP
jgi:prepilin-type N-terminal cleavage/methylation domain-containing protein